MISQRRPSVSSSWRRAALPHVGLPLAQGAFDLGVGDRNEALGAGGEPDQPRAAVAGVGDAFDVAGALELFDQVAGGLLGHQRLLGQVTDPGALRADPLQDPGLGDREIGGAGLDGRIERPPLQGSVRHEEQHPQIGALRRVPILVVLHG